MDIKKVRDWEIIPLKDAVNRKFGYDIYPAEFKKITGNLSLVMLAEPELLKAGMEGREKIAPLIKKGALIDTQLLDNLAAKNCTVVPVLVPGEPKPLNALTNFAKQQTHLLAGRVYSCVEDYFDQIRRERTINVIQAVKKYRTPLLQSLNNALKDWEGTITTLSNDILVSDENLSILSLFDDYIGDFQKVRQQKEHGVEVAVLALMIGKRCGLTYSMLRELGLAALLHDIGVIVYEQRLKDIVEQGGFVLEPEVIKENYDLHAFFGALLLTKKNGDPISGISPIIREYVLEHEQKINGTGPRFIEPLFRDEIKLLKISQNAFYFGSNSTTTDTSRPKEVVYPEKNITKRFLTVPSQILHISEMYVTTLHRFKRKSVRDPHKETLTQMVKQAGERINGQIFETFFNHLVPPDYYPDNLIVKLQFTSKIDNMDYRRFNGYQAVIYSKEDEEKKLKKYLHTVKDKEGNEISDRRNFDLNKHKKSIYLKIDEWTS